MAAGVAAGVVALLLIAQGAVVQSRVLRNEEYCVRTLVGDYNRSEWALHRRWRPLAGFADGRGAATAAEGGTASVSSVARLSEPAGVAIAGSGAFALVADYKSHVVRRIDLLPVRSGGAPTVTTVAGRGGVPQAHPGQSADGVGDAARFNHPVAVAITPKGQGWALVTEFYNHAIRRIDLATRRVTTVAGAGGFYSSGHVDGAAAAARFSYPAGVAVDPTGTFALVTDFYNHCIRKLDTSTWHVSTLAGSRHNAKGAADGAGGSARFNHPFGISLASGYALVTDYKNHAVRRVDTGSGRVSTVAGRRGGSAGTGDSAAGASDSYPDGDDDDVRNGLTARFWYPAAISIHGPEGWALVSDRQNHAVRQMSLAWPHEVTTVAGRAGAWGFTDGVATGAARFDHPAGVAVNPAQPYALVSDSANHGLRKLELYACSWTARPTPAPQFVRYSKGEKPSPAPVPTPLSAAGGGWAPPFALARSIIVASAITAISSAAAAGAISDYC